jgi:hypothetical protein
MAEFRYRGREIRQEDILYIRTLIERYPSESRRKLSTRICEAWQWQQANGALRDMVCRGMLLLPAATQWEIVEEAAQVIKPARDELIRQAAQGEVVHNNDTSMRVLHLQRDPKEERTGVFPSGIVSVDQGWKIALYFTGSRHAGENIAEVLKKRRAELPSPIQMCDALSRNVPKLPAGGEILLANCLAHGRRQFVDVADNFPSECRYVLEMLGQVYGSRCQIARAGLDTGRAAAASSGAQPAGHGQTTLLARGAVS